MGRQSETNVMGSAAGEEGEYWVVGGLVEVEADAIECLNEGWDVAGVVAEVGVDGFESRISDWELLSLACD